MRMRSVWLILGLLLHVIAISLDLNIALPPAWELHLAALGMQVMPMLLGMIKSNRVIAAILLEFVKPLWAI